MSYNSKETITRSYLLRHLAVLAKSASPQGLQVINGLRHWLKGQGKRTAKPGGIGRR
jgi:hypothetical protein